MNFKKLAIANRGEVALRILKACKALQIPTVLLHSEADIKSAAFRQADETICIGPAPSSESYLNIEANISAAIKAQADALHPGFGFLSENAQFAKAVEDAGITFIGPSHEAIAKMGNKTTARKIMMEAGVPIIPGYHDSIQTDEKLKSMALQLGFPLLIKASFGGGGRGIKIARSENDFLQELSSAKRESLAAFGSDQVFLEKYIEKARHIEFQIFGDKHGHITHLFERDCSIQRRHQKIIEESPALGCQKHHSQMADDAIKAASAVNYVGAGTIEFLLDGKNYYFLEMNTRLQVEHPVTEMLLNVDLVKAQIQVAQGDKLPFSSSQLKPQGHVMECRIYAEDPYKEGLPSTGRIFQKWSRGVNRRFDYGLDDGDEISSFYDPMFAKIIIKAKDRSSCIQKMKNTINESYVFGVKTNFEYLKAILEHPVFLKGAVTTNFIDKYFKKGLTPKEEGALSNAQLTFQNHAKQFISRKKTTHKKTSIFESPYIHQWKNPQVQFHTLTLFINGKNRQGHICFDSQNLWMHFQGAIWTYSGLDKDNLNEHQSLSDHILTSTPGKILQIMVKKGDFIKRGDTLVALEAMKMEHLIKSGRDGIVKSIHVTCGQQVEKEQILIQLKPLEKK